MWAVIDLYRPMKESLEKVPAKKYYWPIDGHLPRPELTNSHESKFWPFTELMVRTKIRVNKEKNELRVKFSIDVSANY